jgi:hypothetical protein
MTPQMLQPIEPMTPKVLQPIDEPMTPLSGRRRSGSYAGNSSTGRTTPLSRFQLNSRQPESPMQPISPMTQFF